jgi:hypothetical protein
MGSPYMQFSVTRVNVVRSAAGFQRLSNEVLEISKSHEIRGLSLVTEHAIRQVLLGREAQLHYECYDALHSYCCGNSEAWKQYLWDLAHKNECWTPFTQAYIDLCSDAVTTAFRKERRVVVLATSYTTEETKSLDRAVVFDFTKKGN